MPAAKLPRTTAYAAPRMLPSKTTTRRSSSNSLQRRMLDLYAKQRRLTPAFRASVALAAVAILSTAAIVAIAPRAPVATTLRFASAGLAAAADRLDSRRRPSHLHPPAHVEEGEGEQKDAAVEGDAVVEEGRRGLHVPRARRRPPGQGRALGRPAGHAVNSFDDAPEPRSAADDSDAGAAGPAGEDHHEAPVTRAVPETADVHAAPEPAAARLAVPVTRAASEQAVAKPPARAASVPSKQPFTELQYDTPRNVPEGHASRHEPLGTPRECGEWRRLARNASGVVPYRRHFTSLDVTDWFAYIALFDELFHANAVARHRRPRYLDVAANHARRWSNTWFFDRCMGWDGICVEANPKYLSELRRLRHCHVVPTCVSDRVRKVKFSMTDAYGGVVKGEHEQFGVDGQRHATAEKFKKDFHGIKELTCTTLKAELQKVEMNRFDLLSLDVEGHELPILQGIDWETTRINVIVTENRTPMVQVLLEQQGYVLHRGILKDFIFIHKNSGLTLNEEFVKLAKRLDKKTYQFVAGA